VLFVPGGELMSINRKFNDANWGKTGEELKSNIASRDEIQSILFPRGKFEFSLVK